MAPHLVVVAVEALPHLPVPPCLLEAATYNMVHGIFMSIAFVILFPLGVLVLRLGHSVIGHGIIQALAYCFVIVGLGTGIYLSRQDPSVSWS